MPPRNVLLILTDQHRYDLVHANGNDVVRTPNLDRLAAGGVCFDEAYSVCGLCSPARASIFTGMYPHRHRMLNNCDMLQWVEAELPKDAPCLTRDLGREGIPAAYAGKWHVGTRLGPRDHGFTGMNEAGYGNPLMTVEYQDYLDRLGIVPPEIDWDTELRGWYVDRPVTGVIRGDERASEAHFVADYTCRQLDRLRHEPGWLCCCNFWGPHAAYVIPEPYASMYDPAAIPPWPGVGDDFHNKPAYYRRFRDCFQGEANPPWDWDTWRRAVARYYGYVTMIDAQIGRLLDHLEKLDLADTTTIIFSADHGDLAGSRGGMKDKSAIMTQDVYHIPLIVGGAAVPEARRGSRCNALVSNADLAPTMLDLLGVDPPPRMQTKSFAPLLADANAPRAEYLVSEFHGHRFFISTRMVRWERWKYIFNASDIDELYDLDADPAELENLAGDPAHAATLAAGRTHLLAWMDDTDDALLHHAHNLFDD